ncbi:hypothetical protein BTUL_0010g01190 [Botrytis tulipae]|uniref:Uncharacterized protein n=1 Tax=Botrytis tulipae TaxID=87230 RepID=A0A4Z1F4G4_9HELO|nr:hypothetical protein BTUL_0010g01190 [Botrytis tulipae]
MNESRDLQLFCLVRLNKSKNPNLILGALRLRECGEDSTGKSKGNFAEGMEDEGRVSNIHEGLLCGGWD